jgi:hypothetical protein
MNIPAEILDYARAIPVRVDPDEYGPLADLLALIDGKKRTVTDKETQSWLVSNHYDNKDGKRIICGKLKSYKYANTLQPAIVA